MSLRTPRSRPEDSEASSPPKRRRRPALACVQCRRRKIRCDQQKPCNNCTKSKISDCTFPQTHILGSGDSQHRLETPIACKPSDLPRGSRREPSQSNSEFEAHLSSALEARTNSITATGNSETCHSSHQELLARINGLENKVTRLSKPVTGHAEDARTGGASANANGSSKHRFSAQSSWMNSTSLYTSILRPLSQAQTENSPLARAMTECKTLGDRIEKHLSESSTTVGNDERVVRDRSIADELLDGYFNTFEGCLRILDTYMFRLAYDKYWERRDEASEVFILQLHMCMALGSMVHEESLLWRNAASQWLLEAQMWLAKAKTRKQTTLEEIQLQCLVLLAEANNASADDMHACWVDAGNLVRKAMCVDLHCDPQHLGIPSRRQAEIRRRLWATILELNLLLSLQAGRLPLISYTDYDTDSPGNLRDDKLDDLPAYGCPPRPSGRTDTAIQVAYFDSFKLRSEIVTRIVRLGRSMAYDEMLKLHDELSRARTRLKKELDPEAHGGSQYSRTPFTRSQILLPEVLFHRYFLALHLPVLSPSIRDPKYHFSRRFVIVTAMATLKAMGISPGPDRLGRLGRLEPPGCSRRKFARLFLNSPGFLRHIAIQVVFALALETVTYAEEKAENDGAFGACNEDTLDNHLRDACTWALNRIKSGLTDVRTCVFLDACSTYANNLHNPKAIMSPETRVPTVVDTAIARAEACLEPLSRLAEEVIPPPVERPASSLEAANSGTSHTPSQPSNMLPDWCGIFMPQDMDMFGFDFTHPNEAQLGDWADVNLGSVAL